MAVITKVNPQAQLWNARHIATATTTVIVASGEGALHSIVINSPAAGTITVYDHGSAAGTVLAIIASSAVGGTYLYDCTYSTGLTIVTAAATDITVTWV